MAGLLPQHLPEGYRATCIEKIRYWTEHSKRSDPHGWQLTRQREGPGAHLFQYLRLKLDIVCSSVRKPGHAASRWQQNGQFYQGFIFSNGTTQHQQQTPREQNEPDGEWWPVIFRVPFGSNTIYVLVPMYCPVLAENTARPWEGNLSRLFTFPAEWFGDLGFGNSAVTVPSVIQTTTVPPITMYGGGSTSVASTRTKTSDMVKQNMVESDIANLADIESEAGDYHSTATSSHLPLPSSSSVVSFNTMATASSAASTADTNGSERKRRWGAKGKK